MRVAFKVLIGVLVVATLLVALCSRSIIHLRALHLYMTKAELLEECGTADVVTSNGNWYFAHLGPVIVYACKVNVTPPGFLGRKEAWINGLYDGPVLAFSPKGAIEQMWRMNIRANHPYAGFTLAPPKNGANK